MRFERTKGLKSPARDEVLISGLADEDVKPFEAWAYEGDEPVMNLFRVPKGMFAITNKGITFLTTGKKGFSAKTLSVELAKEIGKQTGLIWLAVGADWAGKIAGEIISGSDPIRKYLDHPQSFVVPYVDLVQAEYTKVGSFWTGRREYLIVTSEDIGGASKKYCITPCSTKGWEKMPDFVMIHRFVYEKGAMESTVIRELVPDLDYMQAQALEKYRSSYGDDLAEHVKEFGEEMTEMVKSKLAGVGSSFEHIDLLVNERLQHYKQWSALDKYFGT